MFLKYSSVLFLAGALAAGSVIAQEATAVEPVESSITEKQQATTGQLSVGERIRQFFRSMINQPEGQGVRIQTREQHRQTQTHFGMGYENRGYLSTDGLDGGPQGAGVGGSDAGGSGGSGGGGGGGGGGGH